MYTHLKFLSRQVLTLRWLEKVVIQLSESVLSMKITDLKCLISHDQYRCGMHFRKCFLLDVPLLHAFQNLPTGKEAWSFEGLVLLKEFWQKS